MEEIKNWWGVFGLFGCVTVVSSSLERRCHRQGSLAGLINPAISIQRRASGECYSLIHAKSATMVGCLCSQVFISFPLIGPLMKLLAFYIISMCAFSFIHALFCSAFTVMMLVGLVTWNSHAEPVSTTITSTTVVRWNGLRFLLNVL